MDRVEEAEEIYEPRQTIATFSEVYDLETVDPLPVYEKKLKTGREELSKLGL